MNDDVLLKILLLVPLSISPDSTEPLEAAVSIKLQFIKWGFIMFTRSLLISYEISAVIVPSFELIHISHYYEVG